MWGEEDSDGDTCYYLSFRPLAAECFLLAAFIYFWGMRPPAATLRESVLQPEIFFSFATVNIKYVLQGAGWVLF